MSHRCELNPATSVHPDRCRAGTQLEDSFGPGYSPLVVLSNRVDSCCPVWTEMPDDKAQSSRRMDLNHPQTASAVWLLPPMTVELFCRFHKDREDQRHGPPGQIETLSYGQSPEKGHTYYSRAVSGLCPH